MVNDKGEDSYDGYVNAELHLPQQDGSIQKGRVIKRVKGNDGMIESRCGVTDSTDVRFKSHHPLVYS